MLSLMTAASAADLAARPYTKAPPLSPATNWSGFYVGAMGGYAFDSDNGGGFGGGTIGYNWQAPGSQFVFGIEIDAAGASIKDSQSFVFGNVLFTAEDKINALGSVTGRIGVAADAALFYAKGGYAYSSHSETLTFGGAPVAFTLNRDHDNGYTVGAGIEYLFTPNWSAKAEYQYYDFGKSRFIAPAPLVPFGTFTNDEHTLKAGVNYRFNLGSTAARY